MSQFQELGIQATIKGGCSFRRDESKAWCKLGGIPTESQWIRVFRNLDKLTEVKFFLLHKIYVKEINFCVD